MPSGDDDYSVDNSGVDDMEIQERLSRAQSVRAAVVGFDYWLNATDSADFFEGVVMRSNPVLVPDQKRLLRGFRTHRFSWHSWFVR